MYGHAEVCAYCSLYIWAKFSARIVLLPGQTDDPRRFSGWADYPRYGVRWNREDTVLATSGPRCIGGGCGRELYTVESLQELEYLGYI